MSHIHQQHSSFVYQSAFQKELSSPTSCINFSTGNIRLNTCLQLFCLRIQPFPIVEYVVLLTKLVEVKLSNMITGNISIVLDGWKHRDAHYLAVFATVNHSDKPTSNFEHTYKKILLALFLLLDEYKLTTASHLTTVEYIFSGYRKSLAGFFDNYWRCVNQQNAGIISMSSAYVMCNPSVKSWHAEYNKRAIG